MLNFINPQFRVRKTGWLPDGLAPTASACFSFRQLLSSSVILKRVHKQITHWFTRSALHLGSDHTLVSRRKLLSRVQGGPPWTSGLLCVLGPPRRTCPNRATPRLSPCRAFPFVVLSQRLGALGD